MIRGSFVLDDPKSTLSMALVLLAIMIFLVSPPMRTFRSDTFLLILITGIVYHVLIGLVALAKQVPTWARVIELEEFARTLPPWIRLTLLSLNKHGWAKRRAQLKLTRKRSKVLADMGLAEEGREGMLTITRLGREIAKIVAGREVMSRKI